MAKQSWVLKFSSVLFDGLSSSGREARATASEAVRRSFALYFSLLFRPGILRSQRRATTDCTFLPSVSRGPPMQSVSVPAQCAKVRAVCGSLHLDLIRCRPRQKVDTCPICAFIHSFVWTYDNDAHCRAYWMGECADCRCRAPMSFPSVPKCVAFLLFRSHHLPINRSVTLIVYCFRPFTTHSILQHSIVYCNRSLSLVPDSSSFGCRAKM